MIYDKPKVAAVRTEHMHYLDSEPAPQAHAKFSHLATAPSHTTTEDTHRTVLTAFSHLADTPVAARPVLNEAGTASRKGLGEKVAAANTPATVPAGAQSKNQSSADMKTVAASALGADTANGSPDELLKVLKSKDYTDADKTEVLKQMIKLKPELAAHELSSIGANEEGKIENADVALVGKYLGLGYDAKGNDPASSGKDQYGKLTPTELKALLDPQALRGADGSASANPLGLSELIRQADAPALQGDAAKQMLDLAKNDNSGVANTSAYYAGAAQAAAGSSVAAQELLLTLGPNGLEKFMDNTRPNTVGEAVPDCPALGQFIGTVGKIKPSSGDKDLMNLKNSVFDLGIKKVDGSSSMRQGLSDYFAADMDDTVNRLTNPMKTPDNDPIEGQKTLANFMQKVMWNHDGFEGQDDLRGNYGNYLQGRVDQLPNGEEYKKLLKDHPDQAEEMQIDAARLGGLLGATEAGFIKELASIDNLNGQRKAIVDSLFGLFSGPAKGALPTELFPGAGKVVDKGADGLKKLIENWVKITPPSPKNTVLPLYEIGLQLPEGDLLDAMNNQRNTVHTNLDMSYLN